jgi:hypothetical protein
MCFYCNAVRFNGEPRKNRDSMRKQAQALRNNVTAGAQSCGDFAVFESFGGHQDDLGALDLKIRQRIFD